LCKRWCMKDFPAIRTKNNGSMNQPNDFECRTAKTTSEIRQCMNIRKIVFVNEQKVPVPLDVDGLDSEARHFLLVTNGQSIATCRMRILGSTAKIERMAVLKEWRGQKVGRRLMIHVLQELAKERGIQEVRLSSQVEAVPFYEKLGFSLCSNEYMDAGIPHRDMVMKL
jgi:predicted GNAT family N-acyltransferase